MRPGKNTKQKIRLEEIVIPPANLAPSDYELEMDNRQAEFFNSMVTQDFRRPLTIISGYCRVILEIHGGTLNEQCKEYLLKIYAETSKMNQRLDTLLNSPRKTQKKMHTEMVDLVEMAKAIIEGLMLTKPERRVKFVVALDVMAGGDARLLRIALKNLLSNAWNYTAHKEEALIEFGITEFEGETAYFVRDNGVGFDMAETDKLFDSLSTNRQMNGVGIGLDTVKKIIHRHRGRVWAEGKVGTGATFYFTLG